MGQVLKDRSFQWRHHHIEIARMECLAVSYLNRSREQELFPIFYIGINMYESLLLLLYVHSMCGIQ